MKKQAPSTENPIARRTWEELRDSGLLWALNNFLHMFGWAIVIEEDDDGDVVVAYPARVKYLAFDYKTQVAAQRKLRRYMTEQGYSLFKEAQDGTTEDSGR
jgi:hypothetical protein